MDLGIWGALPCFGFSLGVLVFGSLLGIKDFPLSLQRGTSRCDELLNSACVA